MTKRKMGFWIILIFISLASAVKKECPGGTFTCPDSATCCQLVDKSYGCCPMENAVCCDDHIHCCPADTKCATGMCIQSNNRSVEMHLLRNKDVICDDQSVCPDETTCCKNPHTQKFGCCPMENAVCCDDGLHCCPEGTTCNLEERKCDGDGYVTHIVLCFIMYSLDKGMLYKRCKLFNNRGNNSKGRELEQCYMDPLI
ncbi:Granulins [Araneus ventricosus]|uniref:Granulins n=1 Tax=Araneus ventricosus TaxID=182803 RepID=A0A4Y2J3I3_ARAVE|nr:Granulins [Araneus ventricosus]